MDSGLASVITLGSSLDYTSSKSSLKLLLPVVSEMTVYFSVLVIWLEKKNIVDLIFVHHGAQADPAKAVNVPVIPLGALLSAVHTFASRPPYVLSWLNHQISAPGMMHPELLEKLVLNNFCKYKM